MATKRELRLEKQAQTKEVTSLEKQIRSERIKKYLVWGGASALILVGLVVFFYYAAQSVSNQAPLSKTVTLGQTIDDIPCLSSEMLTYHVHAHLTILINSQQQTIPAGIGIGIPWSSTLNGFVSGGSCIMWLHTHDNTGIIHIEAPSAQNFTLGQFFDIWGQSLTQNEIMGQKGKITAYIDQKVVSGDPRNISLNNHESIVIMLGNVTTPPANFNFSAAGL